MLFIFSLEFHLEKLKRILQLQKLPLVEKSFTIEDDVCRMVLTWFTINSYNDKIVESLKMLLDKLDKDIIETEQVRILSNVLSTSRKTDKVEVVESGNEASHGKLLAEICRRTKEIQMAQKANIEHSEAVQQSHTDHMNRMLSEAIATIFEKLSISSPLKEDANGSIRTYQHMSIIPSANSNAKDIEKERATLYHI